MQIAQRVSALAKELNNSALAVGACHALAGDALLFERFSVCTTVREARRSAVALGRQIVSRPKKSSRPQLAVYAIKPSAPGFSDNRLWPEHDEEGDHLARELNDTRALAVALFHAAFLSHFERHSSEVERLASNLI